MSIDTISEKVPRKISEYIKQRFGEGVEFETEKAQNEGEGVFYKVGIRHDALFYRLKFDKNGSLIEREIHRV